MPNINCASDLLDAGESAIVLFTKGMHLVFNSDGSGSSGYWHTKPNHHLPLDKVIIYNRPPEQGAEIYLANYDSAEESTRPDRLVVHFRNWEIAGTSNRNWHEFADTGTFPVRYLSKTQLNEEETPMGRIAFVTDSTAGIPKDQVEKYRITVVPLQVIFGTEEFQDGVDLTSVDFFKRLRESKQLPTTSQPSVAAFEEAYKALLDDPEVDSIISIHLSPRLPSGTYSNAVTAAERVSEGSGKKIEVIDSNQVYMGEGLQVINGARKAEEGKSHDEVVKFIEGMREKVKLLVLVDTLEYLQKGGRIGGAQALLGGLLNIKPILHVEGGRVEPLERVRTRRKAMERLVELGVEGSRGRPVQIVVGHGDAEEDAETLRRMCREKMNIVEEFSSDLGPVISTHTGPGVLGFVYYPVEG